MKRRRGEVDGASARDSVATLLHFGCDKTAGEERVRERRVLASIGTSLIAFSKLPHADMLINQFVDLFVRTEAIQHGQQHGQDAVAVYIDSIDSKTCEKISSYIRRDHGGSLKAIIEWKEDVIFCLDTRTNQITCNPRAWSQLTGLLIESTSDIEYEGESFLLRALLLMHNRGSTILDEHLLFLDVYGDWYYGSYWNRNPQYRVYRCFGEFWVAADRVVVATLKRHMPKELFQIVLGYSQEFPLDRPGKVIYTRKPNLDGSPREPDHKFIPSK